MACIAGDGVWCTNSSRRMCPEHNRIAARHAVFLAPPLALSLD